MVRAAPPGVVSASRTSTCSPACPRTTAAASPFGPAPTMHALRFILRITPEHRQALVRIIAAAAPPATRLPLCFHQVLAPAGAYRPRNCRRHHIPVARFAAMLVNQYCHSTARICRGGSCGKGLPAKRVSTSLLLESSRTSVFGTIGYSRQEPRDANHKFQSKRG